MAAPVPKPGDEPEDSALPATLTLAEARCMAAHITGARQAVAEVFNEIGRRTGGSLDDFKIVALGIDDRTEAFALALVHTAQASVPAHRVFLTELAALGLIDLPKAFAALAAAIGEKGGSAKLLWAQDATGNVVEPQGWNAEIAKTLNSAELITAFNYAARRICLITTGQSQGTGFLIGPQTVLTNWHVMVPLLDPATGKARPDSSGRIRCTFEALTSPEGQTYPAVDDWLVSFSPLDPTRIPPTKPYPPMVAPEGDFLDFCAIRVAGVPGRERGWYDLADTGVLDEANDLLFVIQHPHANPQRAGIEKGARSDPTDANFILHQVWTDEGSSGGLCLDHRLKPVALHHAAIRDAQKKFLHNRAVRLAAIHAARPDLGAPLPLYDRICRLADGSRAVLGRQDTQQTLHQMMADAARPILFVRGDRKSGKTFSADLIRDCTAHDRRRIALLSASEIPAEARDLAELILARAGAPAAAFSALPRPEPTHTTDFAWLKATLLPALRRGLTDLLRADAARPLVLWLVIDELDLVPIPQTSARDLLDALYADVALLADMRIVLIGLDGILPGVDPALIRTEDLVDPATIERGDLESCLSCLMTERLLGPSPKEVQRLADLMSGTARMVGKHRPNTSPLAVLSEVLSAVYIKASGRWT
ncbi:MAG TPA: trypsin-like peptidase domain-containing protein [Amaricoccus sp.]|uniref:trypsin-like serine peptidase n=1 Tax=Amaricoccus sp. TaxID=1872485 RepID=UPI002C7303C0|nr:trypsin-like peptidase domain-containing protein [Amaricoccus sp.]HMQ91896.1 trypsin-like peptidase domain-containing protein [Amaricoccus sp.]HMR51280.1 trypsin-like peptidase domain-containing protein [Amaricoccus sp.]HMR59535.1 trypsin-like peptidase domain-containing protein [Amaricoccus sp.]HMT98276.1 trypsin-like peptidase domain-containing protein [Amaricoccus sp.]